MVTLSKAQSAGQAASYHSSDNYHIKDGITEVGHWKGEGAEKLGLEGEIDQKTWVEVLNGYAPGSLNPDQIKSLESLNKQADKLTDRAVEIEAMQESPKKASLKEALEAEIKHYNAHRSDFHKDVQTGGLHSQLEELKSMDIKDPKIRSEIKALEKEVKEIMAQSENGQMIRDGKNEHGVAYHRAGWDLTTSASKSVSIMALESGDNKLIDIHSAATETTFAVTEKYLAQGRKYDEDNNRVKENTGNLISGEYVHYTSRAAEKNSAPDPQLHTHRFTMNLTQGEDGKWKSLEPDQIFKNQKHIGQIYQNELAHKMRSETEYGLTWKNSGSNMAVEIKGVGEDLKDLRSGRTKQIEALSAVREKALGRPLTAAEKDEITMSSRVSKGEQNVDELREYWKSSREEIGHTTESLQASTVNQKHDKTIASSAQEALKIAVTTLSEKQAVFGELELLAEAAKASQGIAGIAELQEALKENTRSGAKELRNETETFVLGEENGQKVYSSAKMLVAEANIQKAVKDGKGAGALMSKEELEQAFVKVEENKKAEAQNGGKEYFSLTEGQSAILTHIATSEDRFIGVMGDAGVGKTTSLERLAQTVEVLKDTLGDKFEIHGLAPTNLAAATVERDSGIASRTIDSFIHRPSEPTEGKQQVYLVDEASMLDTVKMAKLTEIAEKNNAKMVYIGDNKQHKPVGAGSQFDRMNKTGEMKFAYATESMRHKTEMTKEVGETFKNIDTLHKGLDTLESKGKLVQNENKEELTKIMISNLTNDFTEANKYSLMPREERSAEYREGMDDVAGIVGTNKERQTINAALRTSLQEAGVIDKKDHKVSTLENKRMDNTAAQFSGNYQVGDTLIHKSGDGQIKQGTKNKITNVNRETNELKIGWHTKGGQYREKWISGNDAVDFNAFSPSEKAFSIGDKIVFEGNDRGIGISNNETARISDIRDDGKWVLDKNGKEIELDPKSFPFVSHAYAITSHMSQGQSISKPHILADTGSGMINRGSGYVGITRAKYDLTVYTDNRQKLEELYKQEQLKLNAADKTDVSSFSGVKLDEKQEIPAESNSKEQGEIENNASSPHEAIKVPAQTQTARSHTKEERIEKTLILEAKEEQKQIDNAINTMRKDVDSFSAEAQKHWTASKGMIKSSQTQQHEIYYASRADNTAKDLRGGIRYQQLEKMESKLMEKGEINLKATRDFFMSKNPSEGAIKGFEASQARQSEHLNQMLAQGIIVQDPKNKECFELAVSRKDFKEYRQSDLSHRQKGEIAGGAWNHAVGEKLFKMAKESADSALTAGEKWKPKEVIKAIKNENLYSKDMEEIINRLQARYDRLTADGLLKKSGGGYEAINKSALFKYVGSREDKINAYRGEGENAKQYQGRIKSDRTTSFFGTGGRIDDSIKRMTKVNLHTLGKDVKDTTKLFGGGIIGGVAGLVLGTAKTITRGIAGAVYEGVKEVADNIGRLAHEMVESETGMTSARGTDFDRTSNLLSGKGSTFIDRIDEASKGSLFSDKIDNLIANKKETQTKDSRDEEKSQSFSDRLSEAAGDKDNGKAESAGDKDGKFEEKEAEKAEERER